MENDLSRVVGGCLMVGLPRERLGQEERMFLREISPGGIILFERNYKDPEQLRHLITDCKSLLLAKRNTHIWISVDQEGGRVSRLGEPFMRLPSHPELASKYSLEETKSMVARMGKELHDVGINMNLAPVMDVAIEKSYIRDRSFGSNPRKVSKYVLSFLEGLKVADIMGVGKHFPGLGSLEVDPHLKKGVVLKEKESLLKEDLIPFIDAISKGLDAVMVSHYLYPHLDDKFPASLSYKIITGFLREEIGFDGLILTDDLEMKAITEEYDISEAARLAILAGADMILLCGSMDSVRLCHKRLKKWAKEDETLLKNMRRAQRRNKRQLAMYNTLK